MRILWTTVQQGAVMVGSGLTLGGLLSIWTTRAFNSVLLATGSADLLSAGVAAAVLIVTGGAAILPAARRAARTDALMVIRGE
jgi:ABC-type antimicrobial peptide transport system permease subunit